MSRITKPPSFLDEIDYPPSTSHRSDYPTAAKNPVPESDWHRDLMCNLIEILDGFYAADPRVYVSGNLLIFYEPGNRRRHVSPDVFVVKGVAKHPRPNYIIWREGKSLDVAIELTSAKMRRADCQRKFVLYRDVLRVQECFLFDPFGDFLDPPLQGYRLRGGRYHPIKAVAGRFPSRVLGLHLEREGINLRLWNPATNEHLPTAEEELRAKDVALHAKDEALQEEIESRRLAEAEVERLRASFELQSTSPTALIVEFYPLPRLAMMTMTGLSFVSKDSGRGSASPGFRSLGTSGIASFTSSSVTS